MMNVNLKMDRVEQLRQDPDFRALVCLLRGQAQDRVEVFCHELEHQNSASCEECDAHIEKGEPLP